MIEIRKEGKWWVIYVGGSWVEAFPNKKGATESKKEIEKQLGLKK